MAFNPYLYPENSPLLYPGEEIVVTHSNSAATLEFSNGFLQNRDLGTLFLTNARIIFIHTNLEKFKQNFALHLNLITEETFLEIENILITQGHFTPYGTLMPNPGKFKLEITQNYSEFKGKLTNFIRQVRLVNNMSVVNRISESNQVFIDPSNPDMVIMINDNPAVPEQPKT